MNIVRRKSKLKEILRENFTHSYTLFDKSLSLLAKLNCTPNREKKKNLFIFVK